MTKHEKLKRYLFSIIIGWTGIVGASFFWNLTEYRTNMHNMAEKEALNNFNKDLSFRFWGARHGGVYVPIDERTPPNPNLEHIPERDITAPSGKKLTLMNPAYMLRQLMEEYPKEYGLKERMVSDRPLWKRNRPDSWEADALKAFRQGAKEKVEYTTYQGEEVLRFIRPLFVEQACMKCHGAQGYKVGDVRGGISVVVKMKPYLEELDRNCIRLAISHAIIYIAGLLLTFFGAKRISRYLYRLEEEQAKVQNANVKLELKVEERTQDLKEANERLKELDHLKTMFIASMSHELRTPLNSIIGFSTVLLQQMEGPLNEDQKNHISRINKTGKHLFSLISDVMDVSQIEAGLIVPEKKSFLLEEVIAEAVEKVAHLAKGKGIDITVELPEGTELQSDPKRLGHCLLNYLKNAIHFSEKGRVQVRAYEEENMVILQVEDEGIGIAKKDQKNLFHPFFRIHTPLSVKAGGTGLGLYLTKKIVTELLGGTVGVESSVGKGSRFWLKIPKILSEQEDG